MLNSTKQFIIIINFKFKKERKKLGLEGPRITSPKENDQPGNYAPEKQQAGGSVGDLVLCMHECQEPGAPPDGKIQIAR